MFFGLAKQTENNQNRLSFGLFRFEPKQKFDCFEDTLLVSQLLGTNIPIVAQHYRQCSKS